MLDANFSVGCGVKRLSTEGTIRFTAGGGAGTEMGVVEVDGTGISGSGSS